MSLTGYLLMRRTAGDYKGVQDRVYAWPDHDSDELARVFVETTHDEPFDFVFRNRELADRASALASEFERDLSVVEVGVAVEAATLAPVRLPIGVDVAYAGGDFYSAVRNGLFGPNASSDLRTRHAADLNANGLFDSSERASDFLRAFRNAAPSEAGGNFVFYALGSTDLVQ